MQPVPRSAQDSVKYKRMYEDGICEVVPGLYSKSFKISDINYEVARQDDQIEIFNGYCELLNYFDSSLMLQISVINRKVDPEVFREKMLLEAQDDEYAARRQEYNSILLARAREGQNGIVRDKYITYSTYAPDYESAIPELSRHETNLTELFQDLGCQTIMLSGRERLEILHSQMRPKEPFQFTYNDLLASNLTTKSFVCPPGFDFGEKSSYYRFGDWYGQTVFLRDYPPDLTDQLITDISRLPIDLNVTLHVEAIEHQEAISLVKKKIAFMQQQKIDEQKKALKGGYDMDMLTTELRFSLTEAEDLLDNLLNNNQRMFEVTVLVHTYAKTELGLLKNVKDILSAARKKNCGFETLDYMQEHAMNSSLPLGWNSVPIQRTLTTASTAIFIPFTTQEVYQEGGIYYGLNALSKNLLFYNRRTADSANGLFLGKTGSGKSMFMKWEMESVLLNSKDEVIVIDPDREYSPMAEEHGGEVIKISAGSQNHLNPMDININYGGEKDDNPVSFKSEFLLTLCELAIGGRSGLTPRERSLIDRAALISYEKYFSNKRNPRIPTLKDFYKILVGQEVEEARQLGLALETYINGSLSIFAHETNVNVSNRFVVYDIKDLGKQLRTLGMMVVGDQIWNRISSNRAKGIRTWFYTDEIQLVIENEHSANFYFELWSRARKWGALPTGGTQNVETMLMSAAGSRMLSNSDFIMMTRQARSDADELQRLLNISPQQIRHVTNSKPGHGLLYAGGAIVPVINEIPKETELYRIMSTKPGEKEEREKYA